VDIDKIIEELRQERTNIEEAILTMERLALGRGKRRGRPPSWMAQTSLAEPDIKRRGRPLGSKNKNSGANSFAAAGSGD
jgi:hypothetical protein